MTAHQQLPVYRFPVVRDGRVIGGLTWSHEAGYIAWNWDGESIGGAASLSEAVRLVEGAWQAHLVQERRLTLYQQAYRLSWELSLASLNALESGGDRAAELARWKRLTRITDRALARQGRRHVAMLRGRSR